MLGPLAVWAGDGSTVRVPESKVRALLANLLIQEGRPVSADRLAEDLWGDQPPGNPGNTLQTKVSQLRRALDRAEPGARGMVVHGPAGYRLDLPPDALDLHRFRALTASAQADDDPRRRVDLLSEALALWRGPALADFADEPFAAAAIQRLEEGRLVAVEERAQARLELGEHGPLLGELGDLVARHPLRERLRALQLRALYLAGRQGEALAGYAEVRGLLAGELGLDPGPELAAVHQAILRQDPALGATSGPATRARTNLPAPLTELVGRAEAVRSVAMLVERHRLVTLTGPGGVGKTSLAVETARGLDAVAPDGVWLVELAGLDRQSCVPHSCTGEDWIAQLVAAELGVREDTAGDAELPAGPAGLAQRLAEVLRDRAMLLMLDNCEQLTEPIAALAARLLRTVPGMRILATSQEPLGVAAEVIWTVPPLDVPGQDAETDPREFSAVRLFAARAAATAPGFVLDRDTAAAVATICRRLDGIPLALELAATRVRTLGVHELLARLDDRFRLLAAGRRDAPARQRTLRAMIDWSWELLTPAERIVLRRLAVHAEGCGLEAAETVCAGDGVRPEEVLDLLARLVDRSLVVSQPDAGSGPRYRLLESVAAYCLERVREADESQRLLLRHAEYYGCLAERADPLLRGPGQRRWLDRLDVETANLRTALDTAVRQGAAGLALRLVNALTWYWFLRGRIREARRSLRTALAAPGAAPATARSIAEAWEAGLAVLAGARVPEVVKDGVAAAEAIDEPLPRARALWFLGYVLTTVADRSAEDLTARALAEFRDRDDRWGVAAALCDRVSQAIGRGEFTGARRDAAAGAELFQGLGDRWGQLQSSFALGVLAEASGEYEEAARLHRAGLGMAEELGLWPEVSYQLSWLGRIALLTGDFAEARRFHERAMRLAAEQGFTPGEMYAETGLALGARREGRLADAERHLRRVLEWHREVGFEPAGALILDELGFVAEQRGEPETARELHEEALAIARRVGDPRAVALAQEGLAGVHALAGEPVQAARLLGAAAAARESVGAPLPLAERGDVDRITATVRALLSAEEFAAEFARPPESPGVRPYS